MSRCSLCKSKNAHRTHVFPQNSRPEVQLKWVKALELTQEREDAILAEMRKLEQKGSRPRWCTFHFEYDDAGIHNPKYFDAEEGKTAQGWKEDEDDEKEEEEEEKQGTSQDDEDRDRSSTPNEPRRSTRKRTPREVPPTPPTPAIIMDKSIHKILVDAGCIPGEPSEDITSSPSTSSIAPSSSEVTLQSILMGAGLPVPETLQAKTGLVVNKGKDAPNTYVPIAPRRITRPQAMRALQNGAPTVGDAKRMGMFVPGRARGGSTLAMPRPLVNPMTARLGGGGEWPKVIMPKIAGSNGLKLPVYYNHNTQEKYDDKDGLHNFKMPCQSNDCRSELTVIMNRARSLEEQFDDLTNSVLALTQMYKNKMPLAYRPAQSLATISGRAASVAGPVIASKQLTTQTKGTIPIDSLAIKERRERRTGGPVSKEPERLLTADDLASTVRRKEVKEDESEENDEEEEEESAPELEDDDDEYKPRPSKRRRTASVRDADTSASEASPPMLEMAE